MAKKNAAKRGVAHIGTSGWHYGHWIGPFYPPGTKPQEMLGFYARQFSTVEINNSFYRLPSAAAVATWSGETPDDFIFACKASRYTTHVKRFKDPPRSFEKFFPQVDPLGAKLGPVLFQAPPHFVPDVARLETFIAALPAKHIYAFEFRDRRWFSDEVREVLSRHNCGFCIFDLAGLQSPQWVTAEFAYLRLHGPGEKYQGSYSHAALGGWAELIRSWLRRGIDVYAYFDNDEAGYAPKDALRLRKTLGPKLAK